jgi:exopolysaccharide production protein ExoQ
LATAQRFGRATVRGDVRRPQSPAEESASIWSSASTWGLLLLLLYYALAGVSPFANDPTAMRAVATSSAGGVLAERLSKLLIFGICILFAAQRHQSVRRLSMQMKLVTSFPILALLLFPVSQQATRTISSGAVLLGGILLVYYIMSRYAFDQVLELLFIVGTVTIVASIVFALALPQYGLDNMGGHSDAWKGVFSAKNYLGNIALFFLTVAVSYRGRTSFLRSVRLPQIIFCLTAIAFSRAATAYMLTVIYVVYFAIVKTLHRFRKQDYLVVCVLLLVLLSAVAMVIVATPNVLLSLLGKDATFTGRTQIWVAALDSIAKRPLLGYGYQAFWLGLEGESYRVILAVSWLLAQAQNGFIDVTLEMGAAGLVIVLLVFGFAFRDAMVCLFRSRDHAQLLAVEWYLAIVLLTLLCNLSESFLFDPKHLGSMIFLIACVGLKLEWKRLRVVPAPKPTGLMEPPANGVRQGWPALDRIPLPGIVDVPRLRKGRP